MADHHLPDGHFRNPWPDSEPRSLRDVLRWMRERRGQPRAPTPPRGSFPTATPVVVHPRRPAGEMAATWVGHSTVLVQVGGLNVLTDPVFSERAFPVQWAGPLRVMAPPREGAQLTRDQPVITALQAVVQDNTRWGFWKCFDRLRLDGQPWNHKRVHRVYCALRLNIPRRTRRRVPKRERFPLEAADTLNTTWALDFMFDRLYDGRGFRTLNVIDEGNREGLAIEVGATLPSLRVIAVLEELIAIHGAPRFLRMDNGPELTSLALTAWCDARRIGLRHIQPGKPAQNAYIERFNRTYRTEILDAYVFGSLTEVRELTSRWLDVYNTKRPHDSLGRVPPLTYRPRPTALSESPN